MKPRCSCRCPQRQSGFTVIELLVVMSVIIVLAGLILSTSGYVQKKGARSRAEAEIAALSAALESYKADNGIYPRSALSSDVAKPTGDFSDPAYTSASQLLYEQLAGASNGSRTLDPAMKSYFAFRPNMLNPPPPSVAQVTSLRDPFGNPYGYSTAKAATPAGTDGYNPTYDLWSIADGTTGSVQTKWIRNW